MVLFSISLCCSFINTFTLPSFKELRYDDLFFTLYVVITNFLTGLFIKHNTHLRTTYEQRANVSVWQKYCSGYSSCSPLSYTRGGLSISNSIKLVVES